PAWQRALLFALVVTALTALFRVETSHVSDDLLLTAPQETRAGLPLPVRVHVLRGVEAPSGPVLGGADVYVRLSAASGRVLDGAYVSGDPRLGLRAVLQVPADASGAMRLDAWECDAPGLEGSGPPRGALGVARLVTIVSAVSPTPRPRAALPLQIESLGPVRSVARAVAPSPFAPRVLGGVCVPEEECELAVWIGEPASQIALTPGVGVELIADFPAHAESGVQLAKIRVHGPEAELSLHASRDGERMASRAWRLPVALGRAKLGPPTLTELEVDSEIAADVVLPPGRSRGIGDLFVDGAWIASVDITRARQRLRVPLPRGLQGLLRLQVRTDAFEEDAAASRLILAGLWKATELGSYTARARQGRGDGLPGGVQAAYPPAGDAALARAYLWAAAEEDSLGLSRPVHARFAMAKHLAEAQLWVRWAVAAALMGGALIAGLALAGRGFGAAGQADAVLEAAGAGHSPRARRAARLEVVLWALAIGLSFVAAALLIIAKPLWF
ncbi:MAG: hypothetical protein RL385_4024, partial [Pseudomonadota bacterium]